MFIVVLRGFRFYKGVAGNRVGAHLRGGAAALELGAKPETRAFRAGSEVRDCWGLGFRVYWALEYHTLILFSKRNHYEIRVCTFFPPGDLKAQVRLRLYGSFREFGVPYFGAPYNKNPTI